MLRCWYTCIYDEIFAATVKTAFGRGTTNLLDQIHMVNSPCPQEPGIVCRIDFIPAARRERGILSVHHYSEVPLSTQLSKQQAEEALRKDQPL